MKITKIMKIEIPKFPELIMDKKIEPLKQQIKTELANRPSYYDDDAVVISIENRVISIQQHVEIGPKKDLEGEELERENQEADEAWDHQNIFEKE